MKRRGRKPRAPWPKLGSTGDAMGLTRVCERYLEYLQVRGSAESTVRTRRSQLRLFLAFCQLRAIERVDELSFPGICRYQRHLYYLRQKSGQSLTIATQQNHLTAVKCLFRYAVRMSLIDSNPAADLELPKAPDRLPSGVMTQEEAEEVLLQPDVAKPLGVRDRAILEVLYSTGIRRKEAVDLKLHNVDFSRGTVHVEQGKGRRDRIVPIGARAMRWVRRYLGDVRPQLASSGWALSADERRLRDVTLFLNAEGCAIDMVYLGHRVRGYIEAAGIDKQGSCHMFRHTMATLMLEGGADIRFIQAMLGHAKLDTTQIYTRVSIGKLKEVHKATHPAGGTE